MNSPYRKDERVTGRIYQISREFGAFVAVDDRYSGLIPRREFFGNAQIGDIIEARITEVKEDGKLNLSLREKAYLQMDEDAAYILRVLDEYDGVLPFHDRVSPEIIERELHLSKNAFKRAVGRLLKEPGLREWAESLIDRKTLEEQGILDADVVHRLWNDYIERDVWRVQIWYVLMFQEWMHTCYL